MPAHLQGHTSGICRPGLLPTGAESRGPVATVVWNPSDAGADVVISSDGRRASSTAGASWRTVRCTAAKTTGKLYAEATVVNIDTGGPQLGIVTSAHTLISYMGSSGTGVPRAISSLTSGATRVISGISTTLSSGLTSPCSNGNVLCLAADMDAGLIWLGVDGTFNGGGNPGAGTGHTFTFTAGTSYFLAASIYRNSVIEIRDPVYLPDGFTPW